MSTTKIGTMQPRMVAVPANGTIHTVQVSADSNSSALEMAKILLVEKGVISKQHDIRMISKVVKIKAPNVGDTLGDNVENARLEALQLAGA